VLHTTPPNVRVSVSVIASSDVGRMLCNIITTVSAHKPSIMTQCFQCALPFPSKPAANAQLFPPDFGAP